MSEQPKIPAAILTSFSHAAEEDLKAAEAHAEELACEEAVKRLEKELAVAKKAYREAGAARTDAEAEAEHYRYMAYGRAQMLALPEALIRAADEAAKDAARAVPTVPAAPQITTEDPLNLGQLDHTAAHPVPAQAPETPR